VTESGVPVPNESAKPVLEAVIDDFRQQYHALYIDAACRAVTEGGVNLTG
jgi:hypothetical protein